MSFLDLDEFWRDPRADVLRESASGMEAAAGRRVDEVRRRPGNGPKLLPRPFDARERLEEADCVRLGRFLEDVVRRALFGDASRAHAEDSAADPRHDGNV